MALLRRMHMGTRGITSILSAHGLASTLGVIPRRSAGQLTRGMALEVLQWRSAEHMLPGLFHDLRSELPNLLGSVDEVVLTNTLALLASLLPHISHADVGAHLPRPAMPACAWCTILLALR